MFGDIFSNGLTIGNIIDNVLEAMINKLGHMMTYSEYLDITGEYIDERIVEECKGKSVSCYGGKAKFSVKTLYNKNQEPLDFVIIKVELYYKDRMEKWIKSEFSGKTPFTKFDFKDEETVDKLNSLKISEGDEINIDPPQK